jgi:hypothetical protein
MGLAIKRRYRCRYCGFDFPAALPVTQAPDAVMLFNQAPEEGSCDTT